MMINFLKETREALKENGKEESDVICVAKDRKRIYWQDFVKIANFEYNNDFGAGFISSDLMIIGIDWWMERNDYDGIGWWEFKKMPKYYDFEYVKNPTIEML